MTDDAYSPLLVFALANLGVSAVSILFAARRSNSDAAFVRDLPVRVIQIQLVSRLAASLALLGALIAIASHFWIGHSPGSASSLPVRAFLFAHPAPFVIIALGLTAFKLSKRRDAA